LELILDVHAPSGRIVLGTVQKDVVSSVLRQVEGGVLEADVAPVGRDAGQAKQRRRDGADDALTERSIRAGGCWGESSRSLTVGGSCGSWAPLRCHLHHVVWIPWR
jgi:hypothetical protein